MSEMRRMDSVCGSSGGRIMDYTSAAQSGTLKIWFDSGDTGVWRCTAWRLLPVSARLGFLYCSLVDWLPMLSEPFSHPSYCIYINNTMHFICFVSWKPGHSICSVLEHRCEQPKCMQALTHTLTQWACERVTHTASVCSVQAAAHVKLQHWFVCYCFPEIWKCWWRSATVRVLLTILNRL